MDYCIVLGGRTKMRFSGDIYRNFKLYNTEKWLSGNSNILYKKNLLSGRGIDIHPPPTPLNQTLSKSPGTLSCWLKNWYQNIIWYLSILLSQFLSIIWPPMKVTNHLTIQTRKNKGKKQKTIVVYLVVEPLRSESPAPLNRFIHFIL